MSLVIVKEVFLTQSLAKLEQFARNERPVVPHDMTCFVALDTVQVVVPVQVKCSHPGEETWLKSHLEIQLIFVIA